MIQAGFARLDVTPPLGSPISGYFYKRFAEGVLDPLFLNALAIGNGEARMLIISCDFAGVRRAYRDEICARITEKTGIASEYIMLCALHQHTSVAITEKGVFDSIQDATYLDVLFRKFADVAQMALDDMSEARVFTAEGQTAEQIAFVRRYWMPNGTVETNPSRKGPRPVRSCDEPDNTVRLIRFAREGKKDIAYVNFSTHPDVISGCKFSADWLGFTRRFVEEDNPDVHCISITGFQGDSNHCNHFDAESKTLSRSYGYQHSEHMGRVIADTVKRIWDRGAEHTDARISGEIRTVYNKTNTEGEETYAEQKAFYDDYEAGKFEKPPHITLLARAQRVLNLHKATLYQAVTLTVLALGDILFLGIGGEPFTYYTRAAHEMLPGKTVFCSSNSNGYAGYLPHARAYTEGGYEASSSLFTASLEREILETLAEMTKGL